MAKRKKMAKKKQTVWKKILHHNSSNSKAGPCKPCKPSCKPWKRWVGRHKKVVTAVIAIGLCVAVLAFFVPSSPVALLKSTSCQPSRLTTGEKQRLGAYLGGPRTIEVNKVTTYQFTVCDPYPKKAPIKGAYASLVANGATILSATEPYTNVNTSKNPILVWSLGTFGNGASKTFTVNLKFRSSGKKILSFMTWYGPKNIQQKNIQGGYNASINVKKVPNYVLSVNITGADLKQKIVAGQKYNYVLVVNNTGSKKMDKIFLYFLPEEFMVNPSATTYKTIQGASGESSTAKWTLTNVAAGTSRRIGIVMVFPKAPSGSCWGGNLWATGNGVRAEKLLGFCYK